MAAPTRRCRSHPDRPGPYPGPRCATCHREHKNTTRDKAHAKRVQATYGITGEQYWALYEHQGGKCALCQRATGARKRLAVDHWHGCCKEVPACGKCVRMLACTVCNRMMGHLRDNPEAFRRVADYLEKWPSVGVIYPNSSVREVPQEQAAQ